jgi:P4 family phage/plasmid primase-like protien
MPDPNLSDITSTLSALYDDGQVVELRVFSPSRYSSKPQVETGYFDDLNLLATTANAASERGALGVYVLPNRLNPALFARSPNRLSRGITATKDSDITEHTYLLVDIDADRPAGISASQDEKEAAGAVLRRVYSTLRTEGWPDPIIGDSGNGAHLIYRVELAPSDPLIRRVYAALSLFFDTPEATIDQKVYNPARIWKLYGTVVRKGADTEDRPHRVARSLYIPESLRRVTKARLTAFAKRAPVSASTRHNADRAQQLDTWFARHFDEANRPQEQAWADRGRKFVFEVCPFDETHDDRSAYVAQTNAGDIYAGCMHASCIAEGRKGRRGWRAFQERFGPLTAPTANTVIQIAQQPSTGQWFNLTDLGNAKRLSQGFGDDLCYVSNWKCWFYYDGTRWVQDDDSRVMRLAEQTVGTIFSEARDLAASDPTRSEKMFKHATRSESSKSLHNMVRLAAYEPRVAITPSHLNRDPWKLNVLNGTIDLNTGKLQTHSRADYISQICPVKFNPEATCPQWDVFLDQIMKGQKDVIRFLYQFLGYSLTGSVQEQKLIFLHGTGSNGKSTFLTTIQQILGHYSKQGAPELLLAGKNGRHPTEIADLQGARFVVCSEIDRGRSFAEASIKQITGGDAIKARFMNKDFFEFPPTHKLWIAANHKPVIKGNDDGIWRRVLLVPFDVSIADEDQDKDLPQKLAKELPGILNRMLQGCLDWKQNGIVSPEVVQYATAEYREQLDPLKAFLEEKCVMHEDARIAPLDLYSAFVEWCEDHYEKPITPRFFSMLLRERGFKRGKPSKKHSKTAYRPWLGIRLRSQRDIRLVHQRGQNGSV